MPDSDRLATNEDDEMSSGKMLSITQAAAEIGVHFNTLRKWVDNGDVEAVVLPSGYRRFTPEQVEAIKVKFNINRPAATAERQ